MMKRENFEFDTGMSVSDIVRKDYRIVDVFRKHGIEYCCGGKRSLESICEAMAIDIDQLKKEMVNTTRQSYLPSMVNAENWRIDFLTDYIVNIHHEYLKKSLPSTILYLQRLVDGHVKKYPFLEELLVVFNNLSTDMIPHLKEEEEIIFPYVRQIANAYYHRESYASLLVRTLRKPVEKMMHQEHRTITGTLETMRTLTDDYNLPSSACLNHTVTFSKLKEIDTDLQIHLHLENDILFPKALQMEKELLAKDP